MEQYMNLIDTPLQEGHSDLLGIDKYVSALTKFISVAQLPTTLAIQGEWGSGKTSLMNQIRYNLCSYPDNENSLYYGIWVNTWHYSLLKNDESIILNLIDGLTSEVVKIAKSKNSIYVNESLTKLGASLRTVIKTGAKVAASAVGLNASIVDEILTDKNVGVDPCSFRDALKVSIKKCLEEDEKKGIHKRGFLFFIDDLDRIDPVLAVRILEILKNLFEVDNCLFILAIDYDVVVKGLIPKFGPMTEKNEREFRSFFDKIVQLPFTMPVSAYSIETYVADGLQNIGFFNSEELSHDIILSQDDKSVSVNDAICLMIESSTGTNPRSIKRLINTLSLIKIITFDEYKNDHNESINEKLVFLGLICIQISYPQIYSLLYKEPSFIEWDDVFAQDCRMKQIPRDILEQISERDEFDEDWERVVYRACIGSDFLIKRVFRISTLMNHIKELCGDDARVGDIIRRYMGLASVATVGQDEGADITANKRVRVRYDSPESVYANLRAWGRTERIINTSKAIISDIEDLFKENIRVVNARGAISLESKYPINRSRLVAKLRFPKQCVIVACAEEQLKIETVENYNDIKVKLRSALVKRYNTISRPDNRIDCDTPKEEKSSFEL